MGVVYRQERSKTKISTKITALCKKFFALDHTFEICLLQENNIDLTFLCSFVTFTGGTYGQRIVIRPS